MNTDTTPLRRVHHGRNIKRLRDMLGVKQDAIASGLDITQQSVSELEQKEEIDDKVLEQVAKILKVPVAAIKNMNDEATVNYINSFYDNSVNNGVGQSGNIINPVDKIIELHNEKIELYERMLKAEQEKVAVLEKLLGKKG